MVFMQFYDKIPVNYQDLAVPVYFYLYIFGIYVLIFTAIFGALEHSKTHCKHRILNTVYGSDHDDNKQ